MTRKETLAKLIAKVEVGSEDTPDFSALVSRPIMQCKAGEAYRGSLDAAKALHEAVLPGFTLWQITRVNDNFVMVSVCDIPRVKGAWLEPSYRGESPDSPARAWLLAILRALHSMEPDA